MKKSFSVYALFLILLCFNQRSYALGSFQLGNELLYCYFHGVFYELKTKPQNLEGFYPLVCSGPNFPNLPEVKHPDAEDVHNEDCFSSVHVTL